MKDNYGVISGMYNKATKKMSKQIPLTIIKALIPKQKVQKLMIEIGGGWYMEKLLRDYHHQGNKTKQKSTR